MSEKDLISAIDDDSVIDDLSGVPVLPLRDVVVYSHMVIPLFVGRDRSILALCVTEVAARGALGFLLAVPLSSLLAEWLLARLQDANRYRLELVAPWWVLALIAGTCAVLIPLRAYPAWRAAQRVSPAAAIRLLANE